MPRPDFPRTFLEFVKRFPDDQSCWDYLAQSRWPEGFTCPDGHPGWFSPKRQLFECKNGHQWSVTSGTIMHRSKIPLVVWFWAAYLVTTQTPGMSAKQFQKQLGLSRYETAYMLFQKLRAGMVNPERGKIGGQKNGEVEVDEAFITGGRKSEGMKGVLAVVTAALEVVNDHAGRLRMRMVPDNKGRTLERFVVDTVERGSLIVTDGWRGYARLSRYGYDHEIDETDDERHALPHIHRIFSNFKTWFLGTHHGAVMHKNLPAYLNEFVFRFNRRKTPMAAFQTVLGIGSHVQGPTYKGIYSGSFAHPNPQ